MDEDDSSSDDSVTPEDAGNRVCDSGRLVPKSQPHSEESRHVEFDSNVDIFPSPEVQSNITDSIVKPELVVEDSTLDLENTGDNVIPEDISLPSQFLLPNLDDSSSDEETGVTELHTRVELTRHDNGKEMQSINSEADSLVDTKELLEFIVVLLHCGCLSLNPFIEFRIWNNSSSPDVLNVQASISISPKYESQSKTTSHCHLLLHDCTNVAV